MVKNIYYRKTNFPNKEFSKIFQQEFFQTLRTYQFEYSHLVEQLVNDGNRLREIGVGVCPTARYVAAHIAETALGTPFGSRETFGRSAG